MDNPSAKAYTIILHNLRELNASENERISGDITTRELPQNVVQSQQIFNTPEISDEFDTNNIEIEEELQSSSNVQEDPYETPIEIDLDVVDDAFEEELASADLENSLEIEEKLDLEDMSLDVDFEDDLLVSPLEEEVFVAQVKTVQENFDNGYVYDPKVASDELGLPLDLIEEFIQDFIGQAKEFKENLYIALDEQDLDNLRILSHKLKGVAANLRIEDALETLTLINTSDNLNTIEENLNTFYKIISKLAGEEISVEKEIETPAVQEPEVAQEPEEEIIEENIDISFKDEIEDDLYGDALEISDEPLESLDIKIDEPDEVVEIETVKEVKIAYSKESIANEIGIDQESFSELFNDYIEEASQLHKSIQSTLDSNDLEATKAYALKLKGMSDNMRLTMFTTDLESIIHATNIDDVQDNLDNIITATAELSN